MFRLHWIVPHQCSVDGIHGYLRALRGVPACNIKCCLRPYSIQVDLSVKTPKALEYWCNLYTTVLFYSHKIFIELYLCVNFPHRM